MASTALRFSTNSVGVAKPMPRCAAHTGRALMKSRMLLLRGWNIPMAQSSIPMVITSSLWGRLAIQSMYLSAMRGYSFQLLSEKRRQMSSLNL